MNTYFVRGKYLKSILDFLHYLLMMMNKRFSVETFFFFLLISEYETILNSLLRKEYRGFSEHVLSKMDFRSDLIESPYRKANRWRGKRLRKLSRTKTPFNPERGSLLCSLDYHSSIQVSQYYQELILSKWKNTVILSVHDEKMVICF